MVVTSRPQWDFLTNERHKIDAGYDTLYVIRRKFHKRFLSGSGNGGGTTLRVSIKILTKS